MQRRTALKLFVTLSVFLLMTGCLSTMPQLGGGSGGTGVLSGGAAGSSSANQNSNLEICQQPLGTLALFEDQGRPWWRNYRSRYPNLGSTLPVVRMMIQQSNCFVVVERGQAMKAMQRERDLMSSGALRNNSNIGNGQMVAADYTLSPSITFKETAMGKVSGAARNLIGSKFLPSLGQASVGVNSNQAATTLLLIDNRSGVQVSSSIGSAKNYDFSIFGRGWSRAGFGGPNAFTDTDEGKVIIAAFVDSYNQMVAALRNYKPQVVSGGLGAGGTLAVDGAVDAQPTHAKKVVTKTTITQKPVSTVVHTEERVSVHRSKNIDVRIDDFDEDALEDYYKALKGLVNHVSTFSAFTEEQIKEMEQMKGGSMITMIWALPYNGQMETAKIELESWPLEARRQGWDALGKRIVKYNALFEKHRKLILENKGYTPQTRDRLASLELMTKKSLFADF